MQTSGKSCRENADVYPLFDIRIEFPPRHCERSEAIHGHKGRLDCFVASLLAMTLGRPKVAFVARMERSEIRGRCWVKLSPGLRLRSIRATALLAMTVENSWR